MKKIKRIAFLLAMFLLLPTIASCGSDQKTSESSEQDLQSADNSEAVSEDNSGKEESSDYGELKTSVASSDKDNSSGISSTLEKLLTGFFIIFI